MNANPSFILISLCYVISSQAKLTFSTCLAQLTNVPAAFLKHNLTSITAPRCFTNNMQMVMDCKAHVKCLLQKVVTYSNVFQMTKH